MGVEVALAAVSAAVSIATGVMQATNKPDVPKVPKPGANPVVLAQQRSQRAAAAGRSSTSIVGQKLGQVGGG